MQAKTFIVFMASVLLCRLLLFFEVRLLLTEELELLFESELEAPDDDDAVSLDVLEEEESLELSLSSPSLVQHEDIESSSDDKL